MAYANGRIPTSALSSIPARNFSHPYPGLLRADAAASFHRLAAAFEAEFGKPLRTISVYRPIERQVEIFLERYKPRSRNVRLAKTDRAYNGRIYHLAPGRAPVAAPGRSNHGLALAADIYSGVEKVGSREHEWMNTVGLEHGWTWTEGKRIGEPWHRVYDPRYDRHKGEPITARATVQAARAGMGTRDMQAALADLGYNPGPIDGKGGERTRAAVRAYQQDADLTVDGIAGPTTLSHLEDDMAKLDDITKTLARHSQILEALDKRTGAEDGRIKQAADRILGILPQRYGADKKPARVLDTLDGDTIRADIRDAVRQIKGA